MAEISIIVLLLLGLAYGIFLFLKPGTKSVKPTDIKEEEIEVIMAEEYSIINDAQDGTDPKDGVELSAVETSLIESDEDAIDELKKGDEHLAALRELGYKIGAKDNAPEEKTKEDVVTDTEENGRKFYPASEQGRQDPFEYQQHNI